MARLGKVAGEIRKLAEPNFVIAGAQRSGTTTFRALLAEHPDVYFAQPAWPEPKFFSRPSISSADKQEYLAQWFRAAGGQHAVGEKSTSYLEIPGTANRMHSLFPDMRVIVLLRHPVERAVSNYRYSIRGGYETISFDEAIARESERLASTHFPEVSVHPFAYSRRGHYVRDLVPFAPFFPIGERLMVLLTEDLERDPIGTCRQVFGFLGVDSAFEPRGIRQRHNAVPADGLRVERETLVGLFRAFEPSNRSLEAMIGRDLSSWDRWTTSLEALGD